MSPFLLPVKALSIPETASPLEYIRDFLPPWEDYFTDSPGEGLHIVTNFPLCGSYWMGKAPWPGTIFLSPGCTLKDSKEVLRSHIDVQVLILALVF